MGPLQSENCLGLRGVYGTPAGVGVNRPRGRRDEERAECVHPSIAGGLRQLGCIREFCTDRPLQATARQEDDQTIGAASCEISDRRSEGMFGAGNGLRTARGLRQGDPALQDESILCREKGEDLVDATPFPIPRSTHQTPKFPGRVDAGSPGQGGWVGGNEGSERSGRSPGRSSQDRVPSGARVVRYAQVWRPSRWRSRRRV